MGPLLVFGASGHGQVVADTALAAGFSPVVFADDDADKAHVEICGLPMVAIGVEAAARWVQQNQAQVVVAIGNNQIRARVTDAFRELRCPLATVTHPTAVVSPFAAIGQGSVVFAGAVVQPGAEIGENVILNTSCSVDHDCVVADYAHLCPGVRLAGNVTVETGAQLGTGASAIPGRSIGAWSIVGAGATVVRDLPEHVVAHGLPARPQRSRLAEAS